MNSKSSRRLKRSSWDGRANSRPNLRLSRFGPLFRPDVRESQSVPGIAEVESRSYPIPTLCRFLRFAFLWHSQRIDRWQGPDRRRVAHSPGRDEFATLPKSISFRPKPGWTLDSYNFLPNVEEATSVCWFVVARHETPGLAVNGLSRPDTAEMKNLQGKM
jgi:hypothetical protein